MKLFQKYILISKISFLFILSKSVRYTPVMRKNGYSRCIWEIYYEYVNEKNGAGWWIWARSQDVHISYKSTRIRFLLLLPIPAAWWYRPESVGVDNRDVTSSWVSATHPHGTHGLSFQLLLEAWPRAWLMQALGKWTEDLSFYLSVSLSPPLPITVNKSGNNAGKATYTCQVFVSWV